MNYLRSLICESLALDPRYMASLVADIKAETAAGELADQPPALALRCEDIATGQAVGGDDMGGAAPGSLVAIVPITGVLTRHGGWFAAGTAAIGRRLKQLDANPAVSAIVLDVDSPGGTVAGTPELAAIIGEIRRGQATTIVAVADPLAASAAIWTATAAEKVYAIPTADVGSIGVISVYADRSRMLAELGVDVTVERVPEGKARFSGVEPMTDEMRQTIRDRNEMFYGQFKAAIASHRGVDVDAVEKKFGGGEVMQAGDAVKAGLIDGVASIDEVVGELMDRRRKAANHRRAAAAIASLDIA